MKFPFRTVGLSAATLAIATAGVILPVSPASARPIDCSLTTSMINLGSDGMRARANVWCDKPEHYIVYIYLRREDWYSNTVVATGKADSNGQNGWTYATATEPCSDLQTNKTYFAHAYIYDTTYGYPIEVKDVKGPSYRGHC